MQAYTEVLASLRSLIAHGIAAWEIRRILWHRGYDVDCAEFHTPSAEPQTVIEIYSQVSRITGAIFAAEANARDPHFLYGTFLELREWVNSLTVEVSRRLTKHGEDLGLGPEAGNMLPRVLRQ